MWASGPSYGQRVQYVPQVGARVQARHSCHGHAGPFVGIRSVSAPEIQVTSLPSGGIIEVQRPKLTLDFTASHTVYKNAAGKRVPGVTTILGILNKPALLKWAWEQGRN